MFAIISFCQVVAYKPIKAYYKGKESLWEWNDLNIEYDEMPVIKIYYNNSTDVYSRIDRITISNTYEDDFKFPYKGEKYQNGVLYSVFDNNKKKIKIFLDFSYYEDGYFDIIFKYINMEYAYRLLKNEN
jgi:hypothetical protein